MGYLINGVQVDADDEGFLLEADFSREASEAIAQAEGIVLTDEHWLVIEYLRERFRDDGQTPNFRHMLKGVNAFWPEADSKALYELFPVGPAKQGCKVAGLPQPLGKGGY